MHQFGIEMIEFYCPQGRGRSERIFGTLQKRLPPELRLNGITTMKEANKFIKTKFLRKFNKQFSRLSEEQGAAFVSADKNIIKMLFAHITKELLKMIIQLYVLWTGNLAAFALSTPLKAV